MPHINRIRVNNVKYNFGTQYYDDFMMRFSCKNTIYDLANGGGKSVLMLLLLQNMIPNCTLDDKQPIEKLFRTGEGSNVIHSMIEWQLSDPHIKNNYKYMLTGFCARKAKDNQDGEAGEIKGQNAAIDYFNYVIFYRKFNDNDIKNLPLVKDGERITYTGLKNYLKEIGKKDLSLEVRIFDRKGDYQRFVAEYGIYESEWEIIRGINKTEGHVRTYFETNYKTARKVVEDLLIEEIIEKTFRNRYGTDSTENHLAETLLDIKDKLIELSKKKDEIHSFDHQIEILNGFVERMQSIKQLYEGIDETVEQLVKANNTIVKLGEENREKREAAANKRLELQRMKNEMSMKVDTAKVIRDTKELEKLEAGFEKIFGEGERLKFDLNKAEEKLRVGEAGNYYVEYKEYKSEYEKLKEVINTANKNNQELVELIQELTVLKKLEDDEKMAQLQANIEKENQQYIEEENNLNKWREEIRTDDNNIAVLKFMETESDRKCKESLDNLNAVKNQVGLLVPNQAGEELSYKKSQYDKSGEDIKLLEKRIEENRNRIIDEKLTIQKLDIEVLDIEKKICEIELNQEKNKKYREKIKTLSQVYQENDIDKLIAGVKKTYRQLVAGVNRREEKLKKKEMYVNALTEGIPVVQGEKQTELLQYIRKYHDAEALTGMEFYKKNYEKVKEQFQLFPVLAYGIIVNKRFEDIQADERIKELALNEFVVPVINAEGIDELSYSHSINNNMMFVAAAKENFDREKCEKLALKEKMALEELRNEYLRKKENSQAVFEDYEFLLESKDILRIEQDSESLKKELIKAKEQHRLELDSAKKRQKEYTYKHDSDVEVLEKLKLKLEILKNDIDKLNSIKEYLVAYKNSEDNLKKIREELAAKEKNLGNLTDRCKGIREQHEGRKNRIEKMQQVCHEIKSEWSAKYDSYFRDSKYYSDGIGKDRTTAGTPVTEKLKKKYNLSSDEIDTKISAVYENIQKKNSGLEDKQKLLENLKASMEKSLVRIQYLGIDVKQLEQAYESHRLGAISEEKMTGFRNDRDELKRLTRENDDKLSDIRSQKDKLQGKITHSISLISEKYGYYEQDLVAPEDVEVFLENNDEILSEIDTKLERENEILKELERESVSVQVIKHDIEKLMNKSEIEGRPGAGLLEEEGNLEKVCKEISEKFDGFIRQRYKKGEDFLRDKGMLVATLEKLNTNELAAEIERSMQMPNDLEGAVLIIQSLDDTISLIELEKDRVLQGLEDMQVIKDNFENQCIQSCVNIKMELERLDKLSKITMDDKQISILNLKIPYVPEELYKDRMSEYIDRIAGEVDGFDKFEDKIKYIRNNLCWKKLFSVVVTDMNAVRLNLYKRERIVEQSRYLPYEEAVGSTGQSQGIYIQFLISIINYITSINSKNSDATKLRKVIFIDNPFGAAKDIYIWEPIFKLLKTNNVQLVVPARGATPAITGRFDVNYVLGQKLKNGRQQTVVVDYFSNVSSDTLEYTTLNFEQTSLFNDNSSVNGVD